MQDGSSSACSRADHGDKAERVTWPKRADRHVEGMVLKGAPWHEETAARRLPPSGRLVGPAEDDLALRRGAAVRELRALTGRTVEGDTGVSRVRRRLAGRGGGGRVPTDSRHDRSDGALRGAGGQRRRPRRVPPGPAVLAGPDRRGTGVAVTEPGVAPARSTAGLGAARPARSPRPWPTSLNGSSTRASSSPVTSGSTCWTSSSSPSRSGC